MYYEKQAVHVRGANPLSSQLAPSKPSGQRHWWKSLMGTHRPPFWQGCSTHGCSQLPMLTPITASSISFFGCLLISTCNGINVYLGLRTDGGLFGAQGLTSVMAGIACGGMTADASEVTATAISLRRNGARAPPQIIRPLIYDGPQPPATSERGTIIGVDTENSAAGRWRWRFLTGAAYPRLKASKVAISIHSPSECTP